MSLLLRAATRSVGCDDWHVDRYWQWWRRINETELVRFSCWFAVLILIDVHSTSWLNLNGYKHILLYRRNNEVFPFLSSFFFTMHDQLNLLRAMTIFSDTSFHYFQISSTWLCLLEFFLTFQAFDEKFPQLSCFLCLLICFSLLFPLFYCN